MARTNTSARKYPSTKVPAPVSLEQEQLMAGIVHDLKTPLASLQAYLATVGSDAHAGSWERIHNHVARMDGICQRMHQLLEDLRSKLLTGRSSSAPAIVDLGDIIREGVEQVRAVSPATEIEFRYDGALPPVLGDRNALLRVVQNLLENAVRSVEPAAKPSIRIELQVSDGRLECQVCDNGGGFLDPSSTDGHSAPHGHGNANGTGNGAVLERSAVARREGLGLGIARRILQEHGGDLTVHSDGPDCGATATFHLPLAAP